MAGRSGRFREDDVMQPTSDPKGHNTAEGILTAARKTSNARHTMQKNPVKKDAKVHICIPLPQNHKDASYRSTCSVPKQQQAYITPLHNDVNAPLPYTSTRAYPS